MSDIFVLVEHRQGEFRNITFEMLSKAKELGQKLDAEIISVLLGYGVENFIPKLKGYAHKVLIVEDPKLKNFTSDTYQEVLFHLVSEYKPLLTLIGHSSYGMDLAPSLACQLDLPLATDCVEINIENGNLIILREIYGGKVHTRVSLKGSYPSILTVRQGAFVRKEEELKGEIINVASPLSSDVEYKRFIQFVEMGVGEVDITQADVVVAVGRGIRDVKNIGLVEELAQTLGGVLACSRPIIDADWLPKERQVGTSGKTVTPKLYIAVGISGAFQHTGGMKNSGTIVAINKDPNAPIFSVAHYGIVGDLFNVVPAIIEKIKDLTSA